MAEPSREAREAELRSVEARLKSGGASTEVLFRRAHLLDGLGRLDEARTAYIEVLSRDANHFGALVDFGTLLFKAGRPADARVCYQAAVAHHPQNPIGHANLAYLFVKNGEAEKAREHYETALRLDPANAESHKGLAIALDMLGEREAAEEHRRLGFARGAVTPLPYRGSGRPVRLLLLVSTTAGNISTDRFIDDRLFSTTKLVVEYYDPARALPAHDVIFNALGDADICTPGLEKARALLAGVTTPVINLPDAVLPTGRAGNARRLGCLPDVTAAQIESYPRTALTAPGAVAALIERGLRFPLLLRSPGFHTGHNFVKVEDPAELAPAVAGLPGEELLALEFLDARSRDGKVRKYRVMFVGGRLYPLHLAIAENWKVHYFSADMAERPEHRAEDAEFLEDMPRVLGPKVMNALESIRDALGLDYAGIDFGIGRDGEVLLFEANATMVIPAPKLDERWAYRAAPVDRIVEAVRSMLIERSRSPRGIP